MSADLVASCFGKASFPNYRLAKDKCEAYNRHKNRGGDHFEVYRCEGCRLYHIGRSDPFDRKRKRRRRED